MSDIKKNTASEMGEISFRDLLLILIKNKYYLFFSFLFVVISVGVYTVLVAPVYESTSQVYVNKSNSSPQLGMLLGLDSGSKVENEVHIMRSRTIAEAVARRLVQLGATPEGGQPFSVLEEVDGAPPSLNEVVRRLREDYVTISAVARDADLIDVQVRSINAEEAALIANFYAEAYVQFSQSESRQRFRVAREFLDEQVTRFDSTLRAAEAEFVTFQQLNEIVAPEMEAEQIYLQLSQLEQRRYEVQVRTAQAQSELEGLQERVARISPSLAERVSGLDDAIITQSKLAVARAQADLDRIYAQNPNVITQQPEPDNVARLRREIATLTRQVRERSANLVEGMIAEDGLILLDPTASVAGQLRPLQELSSQIIAKEVELAGLRSSIAVIQGAIQQYAARLAELPGQYVLIDRLTRSRDIQQGTYLMVLEQLQEARIAEQSEIGYVTILDQAIIAEEPISPRKALNLVLGILVGLLAGVTVALVRNALDTQLRQPDQLKRIGVPVLGLIPDFDKVIKADFNGLDRVSFGGKSYSTALITLLNPLSPLTETYRRLRTTLLFSNPDKKIKRIIVTSSTPGEGKSTTSANLAVILAQSGLRTLYIDADLRKPTGHKVFGISRDPGLVSLLFQEGPIQLEAYRSDIENLYIIPAGSRSNNPSELLGSQKMKDVLNELDPQFDVMIIDTPPVLAVADSQVMGTISDAVIFVALTGGVDLSDVQQSVNLLREVNVPLAGVVLNKVSRERMGGYGYGYGYAYQEGTYGDNDTSTSK